MCLGCISCGSATQTNTESDGSVSTDGTQATEPSGSGMAAPEVTINAPVATGINIVGGLCNADCIGITVTDDKGGVTKITPDCSGGYFIGQVKFTKDVSTLSITADYESGSSDAVERTVVYKKMNNKMTADEYMPVFCNDSRMHFYSAIQTYSSSDIVTDAMMTRAEKNITNHVKVTKEANPEAEVIYLVAPSSTWVYPEAIPEEYPKAEGQTLYEAFETIATECGAKVIYPLDTFIENRDDGKGYKVYHNTDSHWTTYGAYLALSEMMTYIGEKYPEAKPRTMEEMGFYTTTLWGGDALFSFGDNGGFENYSETGRSGETKKTRISELTTLYTLEMPTTTLEGVYRGYKSTYVGGDNSGKATIKNPNGEGLPTALIVRDSFSCPAYDMVNDRFSTVWWQSSHSYGLPAKEVERNKPDYVIYIVSERNLLKVMLNNSNVQLGN